MDEERRGLRLAARGRISDEELDEELATLDETRRIAKPELATLRDRKERIKEPERDRDALLGDYAGRTPEVLEALTAEERHFLYTMLRLSVAVYQDGSVEITGTFPEDTDSLQNENVLSGAGNQITKTR